MKRQKILEEAIQCVTMNRNTQYGSPEDNFKLIGNLWTTYLTSKDKTTKFEISAEDVAIMMSLLKIARIATGGKVEDNYIDLAGYASCAGEIATKTSEPKTYDPLLNIFPLDKVMKECFPTICPRADFPTTTAGKLNEIGTK